VIECHEDCKFEIIKQVGVIMIIMNLTNILEYSMPFIKYCLKHRKAQIIKSDFIKAVKTKKFKNVKNELGK